MPVFPVGTAANTHSASGSVTGTWSATQFRVAGHLLVAVVSCAATTSVTATGTVSGWNNLFEVPNSGTANVRVAIWVKDATGGDAAPTFTSTETGTAGGMDCVLFELSGANTTSPVDVSGTYASGASSGTLSNMTATTGNASVNAEAEFAISVFAQQAAAASLTWTDAGTGLFSKVLNGNGASAVLQTYVGVSAGNAVSGAGVNDAGAFSTDTSAYGAGVVVLFAAAVAPVPGNVSQFADNAAAVVTSGGTTAPASGTAEAWTVNVSGAFPAASQAALPPGCFTVIDPVLPSEKILVITSPGGTGSAQSWSAIRGTDGTAPVAHNANFSVVSVITAGFLTDVAQELSVTAYVNCDYTGAVDASAAFNTALASLPVVSGVPVGIVQFGPGNVRMAVTPNNPGPAVYVIGAGWFATNIYSYVNGGDCFRVFNPSQSGPPGGGGFSGMTIWGTNATGAAIGLHAGDLTNYRIDVSVINFQGTGAIGVYLDNEYFFSEQWEVDLFVSGCTQCVVFDVPVTSTYSAGGSFDRINAQIWLEQGLNLSGQVWGDGVVFQNGAIIVDGNLRIRGNYQLSASATSAAVLRLIGSEPAGHPSAGRHSFIGQSQLDIGVELDAHGANSNAPMSIYSDGNGNIQNCYGVLDFGASSGVFTPTNLLNNIKQCAFVTLGDVNLAQIIDVEQFTALTGAYTLANNASAQPLFNATAAGAIALNPGTYFFECEFDMTSLSASAHTVSFGLAGSWGVGSVRYKADTNTGAAGTLAAWNSVIFEVATASVIIASATTTTLQARIRGIMRVTSAGTVIPQVTQTTNTAAAIVGINSWFRVIRVGTQTTAFGGAWD